MDAPRKKKALNHPIPQLGFFYYESEAKSNGIDPDKMKDEDLLLYPATLLGFSLNDKFWG